MGEPLGCPIGCRRPDYIGGTLPTTNKAYQNIDPSVPRTADFREGNEEKESLSLQQLMLPLL